MYIPASSVNGAILYISMIGNLLHINYSLWVFFLDKLDYGWYIILPGVVVKWIKRINLWDGFHGVILVRGFIISITAVQIICGSWIHRDAKINFLNCWNGFPENMSWIFITIVWWAITFTSPPKAAWKIYRVLQADYPAGTVSQNGFGPVRQGRCKGVIVQKSVYLSRLGRYRTESRPGRNCWSCKYCWLSLEFSPFLFDRRKISGDCPWKTSAFAAALWWKIPSKLRWIFEFALRWRLERVQIICICFRR